MIVFLLKFEKTNSKERQMEIVKFLHEDHAKFDSQIQHLVDNNVINRIFDKDYTLWSNAETEITNRLDWLISVDEYLPKIDIIQNFVDEIIKEEFQFVVLIGMGGSSLAPEVYQEIFGENESFLKLIIADSTHPTAIKNIENTIKNHKTLFLISTKSGGTVETLSLAKYFYYQLKREEKPAGNLFAAITDPNSGLQQLAEELGFRKIFLNNPNIGGRFSALSYFGLVPAALVGVDIKKMLETTLSFKNQLIRNQSISNPALLLGGIIGLQSQKGIDKLTLYSSNQLKAIGAWVEQLVAESTGKIENGVLPIDLEEIRKPETYSKDRLFMFQRFGNDEKLILEMKDFVRCGFNVVEISVENTYELGSLFFLWEISTAIIGNILQIHPFDQPDVESAKIAARNVLKNYAKTHQLVFGGKLLKSHNFNIRITEEEKFHTITQIFEELESQLNLIPTEQVFGRPYISLQAFLPQTKENQAIMVELQNYLSEKYKIAVTSGFGPRFLHSTGQLHKGDSGNGIFIQIVDSPSENIEIPNKATEIESDITFDILVQAQALGDRAALLSNNRQVIRCEINSTLIEFIESLKQLI